jgi:hypothetical protein
LFVSFGYYFANAKQKFLIAAQDVKPTPRPEVKSSVLPLPGCHREITSYL